MIILAYVIARNEAIYIVRTKKAGSLTGFENDLRFY